MNRKGVELSMNVIIIAAIALIVLVILVLLVTTGLERQHSNQATCGETICSQFNQEYRGWVQDTLECTYNYDRFGYPEVNEVFVFVVNQSMKDRLCGADTIEPSGLDMVPGELEPVNGTEATP